MNFEVWYIYVVTVVLLMSTPGPSQLLILSNSLSSGFKGAAFTATGDLTANLIQMIVATAGLAYIIQNNNELIALIKWIGVAYLLCMGGISLIQLKPIHTQPQKNNNRRSNLSLYFQGFVTSAVNPKAVIFFAALFPQFINNLKPVIPQFSILSATYLALDGLFLMTYAILASKLAKYLTRDSILLRIAPGLLLIVVALGLAMKTI